MNEKFDNIISLIGPFALNRIPDLDIENFLNYQIYLQVEYGLTHQESIEFMRYAEEQVKMLDEKFKQEQLAAEKLRWEEYKKWRNS